MNIQVDEQAIAPFISATSTALSAAIDDLSTKAAEGVTKLTVEMTKLDALSEKVANSMGELNLKNLMSPVTNYNTTVRINLVWGLVIGIPLYFICKHQYNKMQRR